jgi:two-component system CheB/CheR fusion protein
MNAARTTRNNSPQSVAPPGATEVTEVSFPIVGIGASAGGLSAFEAFFSGMPADIDPGMAFVLVQHLAPDHKSILAELIRRYTRMQVFEVEDGMLVRVNCAYIIPPNHDMAFLNGTLQLLEPSEPRGRRLPIDFFFRSLAQDQHQLAIGIVLSGTGSDGTLGVRAIKGEAGMVMVQSPESTEFDGMPRSAIATGLVDWELPPAAMPAQLIAYVAHAFGEHSALIAEQTPSNENALKKIFILLRAQTGHDLSQYKTNTINRRIVRRMALHQIESIEDYVRYLQKSRAEVDALFRDLLIGVTSFFRDPQAFQALEEQVIPQIFDNTSAGQRDSRLVDRLFDGRGSVLDRHPAAGADGGAQAGMDAAGLCFRHRPARDCRRARRGVPGQRRRRYLAAAAGALLHRRGRRQRLPHQQEHPRPAGLLRA